MPITVLPTDTRFRNSPFEGDPDCICSRCGKQIGEEEFALRAWPENGKSEYRYCDACQERMGLHRIPYELGEDDEEPEPAEQSEDELKLGKCCACEREDASVRSFVMLEYKSPEPGNGCWAVFNAACRWQEPWPCSAMNASPRENRCALPAWERRRRTGACRLRN
jgi:hypothetical protein